MTHEASGKPPPTPPGSPPGPDIEEGIRQEETIDEQQEDAKGEQQEETKDVQGAADKGMENNTKQQMKKVLKLQLDSLKVAAAVAEKKFLKALQEVKDADEDRRQKWEERKEGWKDQAMNKAKAVKNMPGKALKSGVAMAPKLPKGRQPSDPKGGGGGGDGGGKELQPHHAVFNYLARVSRPMVRCIAYSCTRLFGIMELCLLWPMRNLDNAVLYASFIGFRGAFLDKWVKRINVCNALPTDTTSPCAQLIRPRTECPLSAGARVGRCGRDEGLNKRTCYVR